MCRTDPTKFLHISYEIMLPWSCEEKISTVVVYVKKKMDPMPNNCFSRSLVLPDANLCASSNLKIYDEHVRINSKMYSVHLVVATFKHLFYRHRSNSNLLPVDWQRDICDVKFTIHLHQILQTKWFHAFFGESEWFFPSNKNYIWP